MRQHQLHPPEGSKRPKTRIGRGNASGQGTTAGKGTKGQKARAGSGIRPGFEGGQLPLIRRLPRMRGFTNIFKITYEAVNVSQLNRFDAGEEVTAEKLAAAGIIPSADSPIKLLGNGELTKKLVVRAAAKYSASAKAKIEAAGGSIEELVSA